MATMTPRGGETTSWPCFHRSAHAASRNARVAPGARLRQLVASGGAETGADEEPGFFRPDGRASRNPARIATWTDAGVPTARLLELEMRATENYDGGTWRFSSRIPSAPAALL